MCSVGKLFSRAELNRHMEGHEGQKPHQCTICAESFCFADSLRTHMPMHTENQDTVSDKTDVLKSQPSQTEGKPDTLEMHDGTIGLRSQKYQIVTKTVNMAYQYMHVDSGNRQECNLFNTGDQPSRCCEYGKIFRQPCYLQEHMAVHYGEKLQCCPKCDRTFPSSRYLKSHMLSHMEDKQYTCSVCDKKFCYRYHMQQHMLSHAADNPNRCEECGLTFTRSTYIKEHMKTHSKERPHQCSECDKTFSFASYLKQHMAIHNENKPYHCEVCGRSFRRQWLLKRHLVSHTEERSYREEKLYEPCQPGVSYIHVKPSAGCKLNGKFLQTRMAFKATSANPL